MSILYFVLVLKLYCGSVDGIHAVKSRYDALVKLN